MAQRRTAILIRCNSDEAERIRKAAKRERRTMSAFVLNALTERLRIHAEASDSIDRGGAAQEEIVKN